MVHADYLPDYPVLADTAGNSARLGYHPALNNQLIATTWVWTWVTSFLVQRTNHSATEPPW